MLGLIRMTEKDMALMEDLIKIMQDKDLKKKKINLYGGEILRDSQ